MFIFLSVYFSLNFKKPLFLILSFYFIMVDAYTFDIFFNNRDLLYLLFDYSISIVCIGEITAAMEMIRTMYHEVALYDQTTVAFILDNMVMTYGSLYRVKQYMDPITYSFCSCTHPTICMCIDYDLM